MNVVVVGSKESMKLFEEYNEELLRPTDSPGLLEESIRLMYGNQYTSTLFNSESRQYSGMYINAFHIHIPHADLA